MKIRKYIYSDFINILKDFNSYFNKRNYKLMKFN